MMKWPLVIAGSASVVLGCATARSEAWESMLPPEIINYQASPIVVVTRERQSTLWRHREEEKWKGPITSPVMSPTWTVNDLDVRTCEVGPARQYDQNPVARGGPVSPRDLSVGSSLGSVEYSIDPLADGHLVAVDHTTGLRSIAVSISGTIWSFVPVPAARRIVIVTKASYILVFDVDTHRVSRCS